MPKPAFIAYRFHGEVYQDLVEMTATLCAILAEKGFDAYSSMHDDAMFEKEKLSTGQITIHTMQRLLKSELLLSVIKTNDKSEGMLLEIGAVLGLHVADFKKIPFVLAVRRGVKTTSLHSLVDEKVIDLLIEFDTMDELYEQLSAATIPTI